MSIFVSRIWTQPGDGIKAQMTNAQFHYYVKSNLFPDLKMLFWPFSSLLIKHIIIYIVEATYFMRQKCMKSVYLFNFQFFFSISKRSFINSFNFLE